MYQKCAGKSLTLSKKDLNNNVITLVFNEDAVRADFLGLVLNEILPAWLTLLVKFLPIFETLSLLTWLFWPFLPDLFLPAANWTTFFLVVNCSCPVSHSIYICNSNLLVPIHYSNCYFARLKQKRIDLSWFVFQAF